MKIFKWKGGSLGGLWELPTSQRENIKRVLNIPEISSEYIDDIKTAINEDILEIINEEYPYILQFVEFHDKVVSRTGNQLVPFSLLLFTHPDLFDSEGGNRFVVEGNQNHILDISIASPDMVVNIFNFRFLSGNSRIQSRKFKNIYYHFQYFPFPHDIGKTFLNPFMRNHPIIKAIRVLLLQLPSNFEIFLYCYWKFRNFPMDACFLHLLLKFWQTPAVCLIEFWKNQTFEIFHISQTLKIMEGDCFSASKIFNSLFGFSSTGLEKLYRYLKDVKDLYEAMEGLKIVPPEFNYVVSYENFNILYPLVQDYYAKRYQGIEGEAI